MNNTYKKMAENRGKCRLSNRYEKGEIFNHFYTIFVTSRKVNTLTSGSDAKINNVNTKKD